MRERRFFVPDLRGGLEVEIRGQEAHHLFHVLRLGPEDEIVVFDGQGRHFRAVITRANAKLAAARKLEELPSSESLLEITLAVAVPKGDKMTLIVRMLTELGVFRVIPLMTERTVFSSATAVTDKVERWRRIVLEACKQSGRSRMTEIESPISFPEFSKIDIPDRRFMITPTGTPTLVPLSTSPCIALIGPEGGWSNEEVEWATAKGFQKLGLGPRTLRTETAAVTVASVLQWELGDLKDRTQEEGGSRK
jgi:16S rRNA (uracil1498-N3)-methyltransferase